MKYLKLLFYFSVVLLLIANTIAGPLKSIRYVLPGGPELHFYTSDCLAYGIGLCIAFAVLWCNGLLRSRGRFYFLLTSLVVVFHPVHYFYDLFFGIASHDRLIKELFDRYDLLAELFNILCVYLPPCAYYEYNRREIKADQGINENTGQKLLAILISWALTMGIILFVLCNTAFPRNPMNFNPGTHIFLRWLAEFIFYFKSEFNETVSLLFVQMAPIPIFLYFYWKKTLTKFINPIFYLIASIWSIFFVFRFLLIVA